MVKHICKRRQNVGLLAIDEDSKHPAGNYGPGPAKISKLVLPKLLRIGINPLIIRLQIEHLLMNMHQERRSYQFRKLFTGIIDRKAPMILGQYVDIVLPNSVFLP